MNDFPGLSRKEAARYLTERGYPISHNTLANLATHGNAKGGPAFTRYKSRMVRYSIDDLDAWLRKQLARAVRIE